MISIEPLCCFLFHASCTHSCPFGIGHTNASYHTQAAQQAMDNVRVRKEPERRPSRRQSLLHGVPTGEKEGEKKFIDISVEDN